MSHPFYQGRGVHTLQSVTKSIAATVIGVALQRNQLQRLDVPFLQFFRDRDLSRVDPRLRRATLEDLLTMRSGIEWHETDKPLDATNTTYQLEKSADWIQFTLSQPMDADPGARWTYNSGGGQLLCRFLRRCVDSPGRTIEAGAVIGAMRESWRRVPRLTGDRPAYHSPMITRRRFAALAGGGFAALALGGACSGSGATVPNEGRLSARPRGGARRAAAVGARPLGLGGRRDAVLQVPARPARDPMPLVVLLHGAGGDGAGILEYLGQAAETAGVAVLAPDSRGRTWDAIRDGFGPDVDLLDRALERVFQEVAVDAARLAVGGFSDGATYAISLGLINGDLFRRVVAFSPGFVVNGRVNGQPRFFVSHGRTDGILPIGRCSRVIVPRLQQAGYPVTYQEFDGGHEVPPPIARQAMAWVAD